MLIFSILLPTGRGAVVWYAPWPGRIPIVLPLPRFRSRGSRVLSIPCSRQVGYIWVQRGCHPETVRQCTLLVADHTGMSRITASDMMAAASSPPVST